MLTRYFGTAPYKFPDGSVIQVPDLTKFSTIERTFKDDPRYLLEYEIKNGDRLDNLAARLYGDPSLHWLIIHANEMYDINAMWPIVNSDVFESFLASKYPFNSPGDVLHYVDNKGLVVDPLPVMMRNRLSSIDEAIVYAGLNKVTIRDHEETINEAKRKIKLIDPDIVSEIVSQLERDYSDV